MTTSAKPRKRAAKAAPLSTVEKMVANQLGPAAVTNGAAPKPKRKPKPGEKDYDWSQEYPGEEVFVFTSSDGTTIGMTKLGPTRKPKPGKLARFERENENGSGGIKVLWYFIELVSTPASLRLQEELEEEDYSAMCRQWAEFAGIELGE